MLGFFFSVLNILGIVLLSLLALTAGIILLVLFFPLSYRVCGGKNGEEVWLAVKFRWLFGLLRGNCMYPEPGRIKVKALCFTLIDQKLDSNPKKEEGEEKKAERKVRKKNQEEKSEKKRKKKKDRQAVKERGLSEEAGIAGRTVSGREERGKNENASAGGTDPEERSRTAEESSGGFSGEDSASGEGSSSGEDSPAGKGSSFREDPSSGEDSSTIGKIKRTICNIYDKIKKIWENITYYRELLQERETRELFSVSLKALKGILKSIRPRQIKADILFGTGAPDTTGYVYGAYCMAAAGSRMALQVTPDFEEKVLEGEFDMSGRITLWVLLLNGWKIYKLVRKLKAEKKAFA